MISKGSQPTGWEVLLSSENISGLCREGVLSRAQRALAVNKTLASGTPPLCVHMHTHRHVHTGYIQVTYICINMHANMHACTHRDTEMYTDGYTHTHSHESTHHIGMHTYTHMHIHTYPTHKWTRSIHVCTLLHMHTCI